MLRGLSGLMGFGDMQLLSQHAAAAARLWSISARAISFRRLRVDRAQFPQLGRQVAVLLHLLQSRKPQQKGKGPKP